jgi:hypothetical protein
MPIYPSFLSVSAVKVFNAVPTKYNTDVYDITHE